MLIPLFRPDFKALVRNTTVLPESAGFIHSVFYYESETDIYFYKPVGSFVYCLHEIKRRVVENQEDIVEGQTQEEIDELKREFNAVEVPRKLYETHIELSAQGVLKS